MPERPASKKPAICVVRFVVTFKIDVACLLMAIAFIVRFLA